MRTLLVTPVFPPARGGIETLAAALAERIPGDVLVVTLEAETHGEEANGAFSTPGRRVLRVRNVPRGGRRSILRLNFRALASGLRYRPDAILVLHVKLAPVAFALGRLLGVPCVQYVHAKEMREVPGLARLAVRSADAIIGVSSYSAELAHEAGAPAARIRIIHNGTVLPPSCDARRSPMPTLITVSRLEDRYKGHDVMLEAMPSIRRQVPGVRWTVVGDGDLRGELERHAQRLGVGDCVAFVGEVTDSERDELLDRAWAYVMLSRQPPGWQAGEGFGIAYIEAGAHGLPTIAGRAPGVTEAVQDGVTGLLVDPLDAGEVASTAVRLLTDEALSRRLGAGGRRRAEQLQWSDVASRVHGVLQDSVRSHVRHRPHPHVGLRWTLELLVGARPRPHDSAAAGGAEHRR